MAICAASPLGSSVGQSRIGATFDITGIFQLLTRKIAHFLQSVRGAMTRNLSSQLDRCLYKGYVGMNRWVGLRVIADNVVNIGRAMEKQAAP